MPAVNLATFKFRIISDDGPGLHPEKVPTIFLVNRPLLSSKLKRVPLRGILGNGPRVVMGATAAFPGRINQRRDTRP
jgi:hypothetical protein